MAWNNDAAPTPANIRKRLDAARAALKSAEHLIARQERYRFTGKAVTAADSWAWEAENRLKSVTRGR